MEEYRFPQDTLVCQQGSQGELDKSSFNNEQDLGASQSL